MNAKKIADILKNILMPGRSLLLPMLILAFGLHVALLSIPIPSTETKEAEDKKNPITVNQIPTEQPTPQPTKSITAKVNVPGRTSPSVSMSADTSPAASIDTPVSRSARNQAATDASPQSTAAVQEPNRTNSIGRSTTSIAEPSTNNLEPEPSTTEPSASVALESSPSVQNDSATNLFSVFTDFPDYQPSEANCPNLGENCRTVANGAIAQVTDFFKKELTAKEFTADLVADEPTHKVFKVTKGDKTLFLNIWQGQDKVAYVLTEDVLKTPPEGIKGEAGN